MSDQYSILFGVLAILAGVAGIVWLSLAYPLKVAPHSSWRFAVANFCFLAGTLITLFADRLSPALQRMLPDLLMIVAFVLMRVGVQRLFRIPVTYREHLSIVVVSSLLLIMLGLQEQLSREPAIVFFSASAIIFLRLQLEIISAVKRWFNLLASFGLTWPFLIVNMFMLSRIYVLLMTPTGHHAEKQLFGIDMPYLYVTVYLLINASLFGCALGRLVLKIRMLAERDPLTGLYNRRVFSRHQQVADQRHQDGDSYALIVFDLDDFKKINDDYGHAIGDQALVHTAEVLTSELREGDIFARQGGEEFVILLPATDQAQALLIAERLHQALLASPLIVDGEPLPISASFGVASSDHGLAQKLYSLADQAMYLAKSSGKAQVASHAS